jgi:hypothetical protein
MTSISRRLFLASAGLPALESAFPLLAATSHHASLPYRQNSSFRPDPRVEDIFRDLASPLHTGLMRDSARTAVMDHEADLSGGYSLEIFPGAIAKTLAVASADFHQFMSVSMGVKSGAGSYRVRAKIGPPAKCPPDSSEAFHITIDATEATIVARDSAGIRRALFYLQDEMSIRRAPLIPIGSIFRWAQIEDRIVRSPVAPYRWLSGWELEQDKDFYPDEYLNKIAHAGMNGIWVAGLFNRMLASRALPELGPPVHRLERLQRLVKRAERYGIKVWLFCIEPRSLPPDHPVFLAHPKICGARGQCLCVSTPRVQEYLREMMRELFRTVPELAGIINIYNGERMTTCWLDEATVQSCPRCRLRTQVEVLSDDLNCFMRGIRQVNSKAKLLAWGYNGNKATDFTPFMQRLDKDIVWLGNFEHENEKVVDGIKVKVEEYSLTSVGPSKSFEHVANTLVQSNRMAYAKLQIGTTYELSSVPYVPVSPIVYDKLAAMHALGIQGSMMNWIIGGYPSMMLKVAGEASFAPLLPREELLERVAAGYWGPNNAKIVRHAWEIFSEAYNSYLCAIQVFYNGPITRSPAYHLHLEKESGKALPYNWGLTRERQAQPFEDGVGRWTGPFTSDQLVKSFREIASRWHKGLDLLRPLLRVESTTELQRQYTIAAAASVQLSSAANVFEFYTLRDRLLTANKENERALVGQMIVAVEDDIAKAHEMQGYVEMDSTIGFQSEIYDYSYSPTLLNEKIVHDSVVLETLRLWEQNGVDRTVLLSTLPPQKPLEKPPLIWRDWLRWGD